VTVLFFWRGYQKQGLGYALETLASAFELDETEEPEGEATPARE
jgi:hypothetical protein